MAKKIKDNSQNNGGASRTDGQRSSDLILVSKLYAEGRSREYIRQAVNKRRPEMRELSRQTISSDIKKVLEMWAKDIKLEGKKHIADLLNRVENLSTVAWDEWYRSREAVENTKVKKRGNTKDKDMSEESLKELNKNAETGDESAEKELFYIEREVTKTERLGNPRYLEVIKWCIAERGRLLGLLDDGGNSLPEQVKILIKRKKPRV